MNAKRSRALLRAASEVRLQSENDRPTTAFENNVAVPKSVARKCILSAWGVKRTIQAKACSSAGQSPRVKSLRTWVARRYYRRKGSQRRPKN